MNKHPERARYFQNDYDRNRGNFDPDIEMHDGRGEEHYRKACGNSHAFDQYEEAEERFRRKDQDDRIDHYGKGPKGWTVADDRIHDDACEALFDDWNIDATDVEVEVSAGVLTLKGTVGSRFEKRESGRVVENIRGVCDVKNELFIKQKTAPLRSASI